MGIVIVTVKPNGETNVEADGIKGTQCSLHTAPYIKALGQRTGEAAKPEMFEQQQANEVKQWS